LLHRGIRRLSALQRGVAVTQTAAEVVVMRRFKVELAQTVIERATVWIEASTEAEAAELKRQAAFRWLGDEAEVQRLQQEQTYHYVRWTFLIVLGLVIAGLIAVGLALLR
jgi:hypothetical protein